MTAILPAYSWEKSPIGRSLLRVTSVSILLLLCFAQCTNMDSAEGLVPAVDALTDQGVVRFDDDGNIQVILNNLYFRNNPAVSELSYIGVWVFNRGANVKSRCCAKTESSATCTAEEENACIVGMGFSQDLGYAGSYYLDVHPPQSFNRDAVTYYIPVYAADKRGQPANYQGEYQTFSSPINSVDDRSRYDLYIGFFFNVIGNGGAVRPVNKKISYANKDIYAAISPDLISPVIPIEARFFKQYPGDETGSVYRIPDMAGWQDGRTDGLLDPRLQLRISEIGNFIGDVTANDYVEIYNPTNDDLSLEGVYLQRFTDTACSGLGTASSIMSLYDKLIPAKGYMVVSRSGQTLSLPGGFPATSLKEYGSSSTFNVGDSHCFALTLGKDPVSETGSETGINPEISTLGIGNFSVISPTDSHVIDFVGYGLVSSFEGSAPAGELSPTTTRAISRCPDSNDTNDNAADFTFQVPTPGAANTCP